MARKRKMKGGRVIKAIERSNAMLRPTVPTPLSTWERIKKFARDNKIISRGLKAVSGMVDGKYSPLVSGASSFAESYGWGKKRKQKGGRLGYMWGDPPDAPYMYNSPLQRKMRELKGSGKILRF